MSRKTRKEKIIAELRRELKKGTLSKAQYSTANTKQKTKKDTAKNLVEVVSSKHVMLDLRKTAVLSVIAVGLELGLYYYLK